MNSDLELSLKDTELVVAVTPSQTIRNLIRDALPYLDPEVPICCASKGIEESTLMTMEEVLRDVLPTLVPCTVVLFSRTFLCKGSCSKCTNCCCHASRFPETANEVKAFSWWLFSSLSSDDIVGAELGGALKILSQLLVVLQMEWELV